MAEKLVLGIDCGTQSLRAALYRPDGTAMAQASHPYETRCPHLNWAEQRPEDWWEALCIAVPECIAQANVSADAVAAIACDGTSCTLVFCKEDGTPLRPAILWMDLRAAAEAKRVEATRHPVLDHCGRRISAEWLVPKTLWLRAHEPEVYMAADRIVEGADWLVHRLCGRWVTSTGNAGGKRHWTPGIGWPGDLYASLGIPELLDKSPDAVEYVGEPLGNLCARAAERLHLSSDCIVTHAGMDGWTAPIGKNCFAPGCTSLTLGTSTVFIAETDTPQCIDGVMGPFPEGIRKGRCVYEAGQTSGGSTIGWLLSLLGVRDEAAHMRLQEAAAQVPAGAEGIVVFDAWRGNRTPYFDPLARGVLYGLTLEHGPAHLYRAVLEGCAYGIRNIISTLEQGGCRVDEVRACGSGAANELWIDIIAAVTGRPILVSAEKQATCLGSAVCAAVACGAHEDLETAAAAMAPEFSAAHPGADEGKYSPFFEAYREIYAKTRETMWRLAEQTEEHIS